LLFVDYSPFGAVSRGAVTLKKTIVLSANSDGARRQNDRSASAYFPARTLCWLLPRGRPAVAITNAPRAPTEAQL